MRDYLEFGRLLGERPDTVKQRLEAAGGYPASDDDAEDYLRQCVVVLHGNGPGPLQAASY